MNLNLTFFKEEGYLVVDDIYNQQDLVAFADMLRKLVLHYFHKSNDNNKLSDEVATLSSDELYLKLISINPELASEMQRTLCRTPEFLQLASNQKLHTVFKQLFELPNDAPLYLISNGVVFTIAEDIFKQRAANIDLDWHNDIFFTIPKSRFYQLWVPLLHNADNQIGTLRVCPKSHLVETIPQQFNGDASYLHRYTIDASYLTPFAPKSVNVRLGQALIFDGRLAHASGKNTTNLVRCTMIGLCHNVADTNFQPMIIDYKYKNTTPEMYFHKLFKDEKIIPYLDEQLLEFKDPPGGV